MWDREEVFGVPTVSGLEIMIVFYFCVKSHAQVSSKYRSQMGRDLVLKNIPFKMVLSLELSQRELLLLKKDNMTSFAHQKNLCK